MKFDVLKLVLLAVIIWLILKKAQELLSRWRVKRAGDPEVELVIDENSGWNLFVKRLFGFLRFVVLVSTALVVAISSAQFPRNHCPVLYRHTFLRFSSFAVVPHPDSVHRPFRSRQTVLEVLSASHRDESSGNSERLS